VLANLVLPASTLPQAMVVLSGVSDELICHGGQPDHPQQAPDKKGCACLLCALSDNAAHGGRPFLPSIPAMAAGPSPGLVVVWPDLVVNARGLALGSANRARAPPRPLPTA